MQKPDFSKNELRLCVLRSLCVSVFFLFSFLVVFFIDDSIWMSSLAATAFIAFAFPKAESVRTRVLLGGYISACVWGVLASFLLRMLESTLAATVVLCVLSIFLTTLTMTVFDFEHPPSAALAVGLVISQRPVYLALASLLCVVILCLIKTPVARLILREPKEPTKKTPKDT